MGKVTVVGLGGSLAEHSNSLAAIKIALEGAAEHGAEIRLLDIRELNLPLYVPRLEENPGEVCDFCEIIAGCNGMIWGSPLYHGTISGAFKNALDWLQLLGNRNPPYLTDKVIGLVSTAGGTHGLQAVNTMEFVVRALRGWAVPLVVPISQAWQAFDEHGVTKDENLIQQLKTLGAEVARASEQFAGSGMTAPATAEAQAMAEPISDDEGATD